MEVIGFAWKTLRDRKGAFAGAFVALLCAAALVCACLMLLETGLRGSVSPERYAGAPVIVAADQFVRETVDKGDGETKTKAKPLAERAWLPESVVGTLRRTPGVSKVVAEVTFPFGPYTGHGWESAALTPFTIARGREPRAGGEIVVDARAGLEVGARLRGYRVVGVTAQALPSQDTVFFSTAQARRLAGHPGMVSAAGVFPAVARAPQGTVLYAGEERGRLEFLDAEQARVKLISMGGALAGTSLIVAILVVVGTFALSIQQRQRELALLRAVAATPRQVRRLVGGQALVVGLLAGVPGAAAGSGWACGCTRSSCRSARPRRICRWSSARSRRWPHCSPPSPPPGPRPASRPAAWPGSARWRRSARPPSTADGCPGGGWWRGRCWWPGPWRSPWCCRGWTRKPRPPR
ncbi:ABC transporter permease [Nonomuraea rubra]|uniref:ABC transporter permease n=1 Tax=Nonomuraea rubra TaxID=46180 RepID=UPI003606E1BC